MLVQFVFYLFIKVSLNFFYSSFRSFTIFKIDFISFAIYCICTRWLPNWLLKWFPHTFIWCKSLMGLHHFISQIWLRQLGLLRLEFYHYLISFMILKMVFNWKYPVRFSHLYQLQRMNKGYQNKHFKLIVYIQSNTY